MLPAYLIIAVAVWTFGSGLRLGGWWPDGTAPAQAAAESAEPAQSAETVRIGADGRQIVTIQARTNAYAPKAVTAKAGIATTLAVVTTRTAGCVRAFVVPELNQQLILEPTGQAGIDLGIPKPGTLQYTCGMGMYGGHITFTP